MPPTLLPKAFGGILPWGLAVDSVIYAILSAILYQLIKRPYRLVRELRRISNGHCVRCGYDIGYDFRAGCPECGWRRTEPHA